MYICFQSKLIMFDAWYNKMMPSGTKMDLGMTDTDSFLFKVSNRDKFMDHCEDFMDYSNYPPDHPKFSLANKAKLGYFKDELCGKLKCLEFVGLRSKCYAMRLEDMSTSAKSDKKVCKGIGRSAIKNRLKFDQYKSCLYKHSTIRENFYSIRSVKQNIKTVLINKKALNFIDTKRWIFDCGIHSVPYGSYLIKKNFNVCPKCN